MRPLTLLLISVVRHHPKQNIIKTHYNNLTEKNNKELIRKTGFPDSSAGKESTHSAGGLDWVGPGLDPWVGKMPWRRERLPTLVFWPGELHELYSPWGRKESDTTERLSLHFTSLHFTSLHLIRKILQDTSSKADSWTGFISYRV